MVETPQEPNDITRWVIDGNFKYSKNGGLSGTIESNTIGMANPELYPNGNYEIIEKRVGTRSMSPGVPIYSLMFPISGSITTYKFSNQLPPYSTDVSIETNKNRLGELGLASFYPDGWWTDPFSSNLIG